MTAFLSDVLNEIRDNIKFLEAKNAAIITLNSALIAWSGGVVFDSEINRNYRGIVSVFAIFLIFPLLISISSFKPFHTIHGKYLEKWTHRMLKDSVPSAAPSKMMYYAYICQHYRSDVAKYYSDIKCTTDSDTPSVIVTSRIQQIMDLSAVAYRKAVYFNFAVLAESAVFILGIIIAICCVVFRFL